MKKIIALIFCVLLSQSQTSMAQTDSGLAVRHDPSIPLMSIAGAAGFAVPFIGYGGAGLFFKDSVQNDAESITMGLLLSAIVSSYAVHIVGNYTAGESSHWAAAFYSSLVSWGLGIPAWGYTKGLPGVARYSIMTAVAIAVPVAGYYMAHSPSEDDADSKLMLQPNYEWREAGSAYGIRMTVSF